MDTILKFVNKPIQPTSKNIFWYILTLVISNLLFYLVYSCTCVCRLFWKLKFIPKNFRVLGVILISIFFLILLVIEYLYFFNFKTQPGQSLFLKVFVWAIEVYHFAIFSLYFYSIFNIITLKYSPMSLIYFSLLNIIHAIYNSCPIIDTQNFLNPAAGNEQFLNIYWQGYFGDLSQIMRLVFLISSVLTLYLAFYQLKKLKHDFKYLDFYFPWQDRKLNPAKVKLKAVL
ncbi:MAG: hypothetical protein WCK98_00040 [bacterium]